MQIQHFINLFCTEWRLAHIHSYIHDSLSVGKHLELFWPLVRTCLTSGMCYLSSCSRWQITKVHKHITQSVTLGLWDLSKNCEEPSVRRPFHLNDVKYVNNSWKLPYIKSFLSSVWLLLWRIRGEGTVIFLHISTTNVWIIFWTLFVDVWVLMITRRNVRKRQTNKTGAYVSWDALETNDWKKN